MSKIDELKDADFAPKSEPLMFQEVGAYVIEPNGVFQKIEVKTKDSTEIKNERISYTPIVIAACGHNIDNGEKSVQLEYIDIRKRRCTLWLPAKEALSRDIIKVASWGINFAEKRCKGVNEYLSYYLYANGEKIPELPITQKNGWKNNNRSFITGELSYSADDTAKIINNGDRYINQALKPHGEVAEWVKAVSGLMEYPNVRFKCYAALTAPILRLLNQQSFLVHNYDDSSVGKSTISNIAMSQIGDPKTLEYSANSTQVGAERLAETYTDLPLNLDETSVAKPEILKSIVYMLANERGKTRGNRESQLREVSTWKTVCLTTGETSITGDTTFTGAKLRIVEIFGGIGAYVPELVDKAKGIYEHSGHVLPLYLKYVFENKKELNKKFTEYRDLFKKETSGATGMDARLIDTFAAITTAGYIVEMVYKEIDIPEIDPVTITKAILKNTIAKRRTEKYGAKALEMVASWVETKSKFFITEYGDAGTTDDEKRYDIFGWIAKDATGKEFVDILPALLKKFLTDAEYSPERCLEDWRDQEIIVCSKDRFTITQRHSFDVKRVIRFKKERLINDIGGDSGE